MGISYVSDVSVIEYDRERVSRVLYGERRVVEVEVGVWLVTVGAY